MKTAKEKLFAGLLVLVFVITFSVSQIVLAQQTESDKIGDENNGCPTGGMANTHCAIWNITYTQGWLKPSISCSTGGKWKCYEGECPHGN